MVNQQRVWQEFVELVTIPCSTKNERQIADVLKAKLTALGCTVTEDNVGDKIGGNTGNMYGYLKGNKPNAPVVMFGCHMDCVEPCTGIKPQRHDGLITSDGTTILGSDDKAGVVGILEALRLLKEEKADHGDVQIVFTVSEEGGLSGSKNMDAANLKADIGYELDASGDPGGIITMAPGQCKVNVTVEGRAAHAGLAPEEGVNALTIAGKALALIPDGRIDEETTANVALIHGGIATNIVTDKVEITGEARSRNLDKLAKLTATIKETYERVASENGGKATVQIVKAYEPFVLAEDSTTVAVAKEAMKAAGLTPVVTATGGGSDANFYNSYGVATAVVAVGMSKVHTKEEFIKEEHLYQVPQLVLEIIKATAKQHK